MSPTLSFLIASAALTVGPSLPSESQDGVPPGEFPARPLASIVVRQSADPLVEQIPAPGSQPNPAIARDEDLIVRALARPQPAEAPARLDQGGELVHGPGMFRSWQEYVSFWEAPAFCHRPLYFEDENLERHGRSWGLLQPAVSVVHFTGRGLAWPYLAGAFPPHECIYTLGRQRAGSYEPYHWYRPPVSARGAVYEASVATGLSFIVP